MLLKLELLKKCRTEQPQREAPVGSFGKLVNSSRSPSAWVAEGLGVEIGSLECFCPRPSRNSLLPPAYC